MGLGDALYVQAVARHLVNQGETLKVCTAWPDVFKPLGKSVVCAPFTRLGINILAHYSQKKALPDSDQFEDCCKSAGILEPVDLKLDWKLENRALADNLRRHGKPIICVQMPRSPMGRTDGFGADLLPDCRRIQQAIDAIGDKATLVQIGTGEPLFRFKRIHIDLTNRTTVSELLDVSSIADGFLGYVSFMVPLAESFSKPGLFVWSRRGLNSGQQYVRLITPKKILHRETSHHVIDDCDDDSLVRAVGETFGCAS